MAQLSIFEKQKHYSKKDFTCSIGKYDVVYITFRNDSWLRFTKSDSINIRVEGRVLKFDDPETTKSRAAVFKLKQSKLGNPEINKHTRYIHISGKAWPGILEVVQRTAGSYDFPKKEEPTTSEELAAKFKPDIKAVIDDIVTTAPTTLRLPDSSDMSLPERFMSDARELLAYAETSEERIAIYNTLREIYRVKINNSIPLTKWDIP